MAFSFMSLRVAGQLLSVIVGLYLSLGTVMAASELAVKENCLSLVRKYNYELALQQCEYEADRGSAIAAEILGYVYLKGKSGIRDWDLARRYFEQARDAGEKHASGFLGVIYWHGLGVERDEDRARGYFTECAHIPALPNSTSCAAIFARTLSLESNYPDVRVEGLTWYGRLVEAGDFVYLYNYAAVAARLGQWKTAYSNAEFFKMWAKRYGELWNLRQKYLSAERISAKALAELTPTEAGLLSVEVRKKLNRLNKNQAAPKDWSFGSEAERAAYYLKWQE